MQELIFRTEYLTTLRSNIAGVEAPAGQELVHTALALPAPEVLSHAAGSLQAQQALKQLEGPVPKNPYAPYSRPCHPPPGLGGGGPGAGQSSSSGATLEAGQRCRAMWEDLTVSRPGSPAAGSREVWRGAAAHRSRAETAVDTRTAWEALPQHSMGYLFDGVHSMLAATPSLPGAALALTGGGTLGTPRSTLKSLKLKAPEVLADSYAKTPRNPLDTLKVKPVPGVPRSALCEHHGHAAVLEVAKHAGSSNYVQQLTEEGLGDTAASGLQFARHLWRKQAAAAESGEETLSPRAVSTAAEGWFRFCRADGAHEILGASKYLLSEQSTALVRSVASNPFHSHALVSSDRPIHLFSDGHYFEIVVRSVFTDKHEKMGADEVNELLSPKKPGHEHLRRDVRGGSEGLVLGVTTTALPELSVRNPSAKVATDVPRSWCVATSGKFYATSSPTPQPKRPVSQDRIRLRPRWHQRPGASEHLACPWPPPAPPTAETGRQLLDWSHRVREGDRVGLLVTAFGGLCVVVNGRREAFLPDAGVPVDTDLYPLVEAFNHIRCIQALPWAEPPK